MLKATNKQILEVTNTNSPYFERIVFFVRPEHKNTTKTDLQKEAERFSGEIKRPPKLKKSPKQIATALLFAVLGTGAGAALTYIMGTIA